VLDGPMPALDMKVNHVERCVLISFNVHIKLTARLASFFLAEPDIALELQG